MIGSIISGAMKLGGAVIGGILSGKESRKQEKLLKQQKADNEAWYNRRYNEDGTQRADAQRLLTNTQEQLRKQTQAAQGASAVTGASTESVAAQKAANLNALADATSTIAAASDARKDNIEQQYQQNANANTNAQIQVSQNKQQQIQAATSQVGSSADAFSKLK